MNANERKFLKTIKSFLFAFICVHLRKKIIFSNFRDLSRTVIRRFFGDGHIMYVRLRHTCTGNTNKLRFSAHLVQIGTTHIAHTGARCVLNRNLFVYRVPACLSRTYMM